MLVAFTYSVIRMDNVLKNLVVHKSNMQRNLEASSDKIVGEPLYILLTIHGHPNAHEHVRKLMMKAHELNRPFPELIDEDETLKPYLDKFTEPQRELIREPSKYTGIAAEKAEKVVRFWDEKLNDLFI